jgi:uncharacterized phage infection (PIP) family protein YhgE
MTDTTDELDFDSDAAFDEAAAAISGAPELDADKDDAGSQNEQTNEAHTPGLSADEQAADTAQEEAPEVATLKAEIARLQHGWNSDRGRLSALTKKLEQVESRTSQAAHSPAEMAGMDDEELAQFAEDFPEHANAVERLIQRRLAEATGELDARLSQLAQPIEQLEQSQAAAVIAQQQQALLAVHPDAYEVAASPQFAQWLNDQPPQVQQIYRDSDSARDSAWLISQFKSAHQLTAQQRQNQQSRQLNAMSRLPTKGASRGASPMDALDDDALFEHLARQSGGR